MIRMIFLRLLATGSLLSILQGTLLLEARLSEGAQAARIDEDQALKVLKQLGDLWEKDLPPEQLLGIYFGRKWVGQATLAVSVPPKGEAGAYEVSWTVETKISGQRLYTHDQIRLARDLALLSAQSSEDGPEGKVSKTLSVQGGHFRVRTEAKGKASYQEGAVKPGSTWNASILPLFGLPEPPSITFPVLDGDQSPVVLARPSEEKSPPEGSGEAGVKLLEVRRGEDPPGLWRFSKENRPVEFRPGGSPMRFRVIALEARGKDLQEPLSLSEPARVLVDLCRAVKRGDRVAVAAAFDFELLAQGLVNNFTKLDATTRRHVLDSLRSKTPLELISARFRDGLPDESLIEDLIAWGSKAIQKEETAEVRLLGMGMVWKFHRAADGNQKGKWLVSGFQGGSP
jgi:hypothetical protein